MLKKFETIIQDANKRGSQLLKDDYMVVKVFEDIDNQLMKNLYPQLKDCLNLILNDTVERDKFKLELKETHTYALQLEKASKIYNIESVKELNEVKCFLYSISSYERFLERIDIRYKQKLGL